MQSNTQYLTIGEVLPSNMRSNYSSEVLQTPLQEAINIVKYDMPSTTGLGAHDISEIKEIYKEYQDNQQNASTSSEESDTGYWDKSEQENDAYWDKNN